MKKHLQTNFLKFILEKYNREIQKEEELNNSDDEDKIDEIEIEELNTRGNQDEDFNLDELIEEYNKLTEKHKKIKNDNSLYNKQ